MAALSKLRELSLPYNCYEVGHTWTPICSEAALTVGYICLVEAMKIYAPLYLVSQAVQRKFSLSAFFQTVQSIYTSSFFLSFNGFAFIFIFCLLRKFMGKFYYLHCSYFPAFVASFMAILIERKTRRGPLALYVTNVASETIFRMAAARGKIHPLPEGEVLLFSSTMAFFLYIIRKQGFTNDFISMGIKYILGSEEAKKSKKAKSYIHKTKENFSTAEDCVPKCISDTSLESKKTNFLKNFFNSVKHQSCPHALSCPHYVLKGFLRPCLMGCGTSIFVRILSSGMKFFSNPEILIKILTESRSYNLGLFLGGFGGTFRLVMCLCRWLFGRDRELYALPAAFVGGLFMKFFPSSTLALYLMWKLIEVIYLLGIEQGKLPDIRGSMLILYAASTAVLFYAAVLEPHNLKPAYLKFLSRLTQNRIGEINRHVLDIFGTHASKLYTNFWPELDLKHTSRVFQESVLLWLIH